jgi:hypothetical protein
MLLNLSNEMKKCIKSLEMRFLRIKNRDVEKWHYLRLFKVSEGLNNFIGLLENYSNV